MTHAENLPTQPIHKFTLARLAFIGWIIGLAVILVFILPVLNHSHPDWPKYWMIRPLIITPLAGAVGGVWYYLMDFLRYQGRWKTVVAYVLSFIGCFIAIWLGIVLGLVGTMWH